MSGRGSEMRMMCDDTGVEATFLKRVCAFLRGTLVCDRRLCRCAGLDGFHSTAWETFPCHVRSCMQHPQEEMKRV